ncbi:PD-(D/E)XK nuclease family protein, partial [Acinetobacter baumannii]
AGASLEPEERQAIEAEVAGVLADPDFAPLFASGSRAEVPIVGEVKTGDGGHYAVSGQIDRLAVVGNDVLILDYKTNRNPPRDVPETYAVQ